MEMLAPNPTILALGFVQLGAIVVALLVRSIASNTARQGPLLWMKMNKPIVSVILGVSWAMIAYVMFHAAPLDDHFVAGVWLAGGSGLLASLAKDGRDGSWKATDELDVIAMRRKNPKHGGIGS